MLLKLTKDQVRAHLKAVWNRDGQCSICASNAWNVLDDEFIIWNDEQTKKLPVAIIACERCGATHLLASEVIKKRLF